MRFTASAALCVLFALASAVFAQEDVVGREVDSDYHHKAPSLYSDVKLKILISVLKFLQHKPQPPSRSPPCPPCARPPVCAKGRKCEPHPVCRTEGEANITCPLQPARRGDDHNNQGKGDGGHNPGKGDGHNPGKADGHNPGKGDGNNPGKGDGHNPGKGDGHNPGKGDGTIRAKEKGTVLAKATGTIRARGMGTILAKAMDTTLVKVMEASQGKGTEERADVVGLEWNMPLNGFM
ncbi:hypothetical protein B0H19DRAFT_1060636 [Mycena capillaripes]|nr:hypothetical protein B0H19DRAFT_1060636 [Mycena capillaripes]